MAGSTYGFDRRGRMKTKNVEVRHGIQSHPPAVEDLHIRHMVTKMKVDNMYPRLTSSLASK
ncbi:hypothetical protein ACJMK2_042839 [Sinanodonta woodiana]|uniref:Uncharacterized protein n=1 Tax=Sinanodonta woodiana TaxID=1069815 RepID=A0ABD3VWE3_SINWO